MAAVSPSTLAIDYPQTYSLVRVTQHSSNFCGYEYCHTAVTFLLVEYIIRRNRCIKLLDCIEANVDTITVEYANAIVILAGDFNSLDHTKLSSRSMLTAIVNQSTRGTNVLDQIFVNYTIYDAVKVVTPTVRSDHRAVIAYTGTPPCQLNKTRERRIFRRCSPTQHSKSTHQL